MRELEAIRDLIRHWREADINPRAAEEIEALLPALEAAIQDVKDVAQEEWIDRVHKLQAEIAALRQPMSCTHPKACWQATKPDSVDAVVGYRCVACEHERLAVAAVCKDAAEFIRQHWGDSDMLADEWLKRGGE